MDLALNTMTFVSLNSSVPGCSCSWLSLGLVLWYGRLHRVYYGGSRCFAGVVCNTVIVAISARSVTR